MESYSQRPFLGREADGVKAESESYGYDLLSRLVSWSKSPVGKTYGFDPFGNLTSYAGRSLAVDAGTNRLVHGSYDGSSNLTALMGLTFSWDALNQKLRISGQGLHRRFAYDAAGERLILKPPPPAPPPAHPR